MVASIQSTHNSCILSSAIHTKHAIALMSSHRHRVFWTQSKASRSVPAGATIWTHPTVSPSTLQPGLRHQKPQGLVFWGKTRFFSHLLSSLRGIRLHVWSTPGLQMHKQAILPKDYHERAPSSFRWVQQSYTSRRGITGGILHSMCAMIYLTYFGHGLDSILGVVVMTE